MKVVDCGSWIAAGIAQSAGCRIKTAMIIEEELYQHQLRIFQSP
jgi:hypothetical protein